MGHAALCMRMTEEEYLAFERSSPEKHEFADGEIFAMSGGTAEHSAVSANIIAELRSMLFGQRCRVHTSDMRIKIPSSGRYVYPDASVACARSEYADAARDTLLNPRVVIEVLSESSEAYDRGEKFEQYRTIPTLTHYVIASQTKPHLEVYTRQEDDGWLLRAYGPGDRAALPALGCALDVDRVYTDVFEPEPA